MPGEGVVTLRAYRADAEDLKGIIDFVDILGSGNPVCEEGSDGPAYKEY